MNPFYFFFDGTWGAFGRFIFSLLTSLLVFGVVVLLAAACFGQRRTPRPGISSALQALEERYARGEIDRDEFVERKEVLSGRDRSVTG